MLHTTINKCRESNACVGTKEHPEGIAKLSLFLGGSKKYGEDKPIPLAVIVESNGLADALWTLRCTVEPLEVTEKILIEFACRCAEHTLHFYEDKYPDDKRPRQAIEAARVCITDKSPAAESARSAAWSAAESAAWSAAESARSAAWSARSAAWSAAESAAESARSAAWSAAWSAAELAAWSAAWSAAELAAELARSAETEWQTKAFLELLNKN